MLSRLCVLFVVFLALGCGTSPNDKGYEVVLSKLPKKGVNRLSQLATTSQDSIFIVQRKPNLIPFSSLHDKKFVLLHFGEQYKHFEQSFHWYANSTSLVNPVWHSLIQLNKQQQQEEAMLVVLIDSSVVDYPYFSSFIWVINHLSKQYATIIVNFGSPNALAGFDTNITMVKAPRRNAAIEILTAQALFGAIPTNNALFEAQHMQVANTSKNPKIRWAYTSPTQVGLAEDSFMGIDSLALLGIAEGAFPGCQVLVAKDGDVIYNKSFGSPTYEKGELSTTMTFMT